MFKYMLPRAILWVRTHITKGRGIKLSMEEIKLAKINVLFAAGSWVG